MPYLPRRSRWPLLAFAAVTAYVCMIGVVATCGGSQWNADRFACPKVGWDSRADDTYAAKLEAEVELLRLALPAAVDRSFLDELADDPFEWRSPRAHGHRPR